MKRQDGTPTNGIHGYMKHLLTATQAIEPTHIVTCWDMGSTTFRTESFSNYKANRAAPPEELIPQFDLVQEMTAKLSIPVIGMKATKRTIVSVRLQNNTAMKLKFIF